MAHLATRLARLLRARSTVLLARTLQVLIPTKLTVPGPTQPAPQLAARSARQTAKAEAHSEAQVAEWAVCSEWAQYCGGRCLLQHSHASPKLPANQIEFACGLETTGIPEVATITIVTLVIICSAYVSSSLKPRIERLGTAGSLLRIVMPVDVTSTFACG